MGGVESWRCLCVIRSATCGDGNDRAVFSLHLVLVCLSYFFFFSLFVSLGISFFFFYYYSVLCALCHQCKSCVFPLFFFFLMVFDVSHAKRVVLLVYLIFCVFFFFSPPADYHNNRKRKRERVCVSEWVSEWVSESEGHRNCSRVVVVGSVFIPGQTKMRWRITGAFGFCVSLSKAKSEIECLFVFFF